MHDEIRAVRLLPERVWRTYIGGRLLDVLRGQEGQDGSFPEEWLMSVVRAANAGREEIVEGPSWLADTPDQLFSQLVEADPATWLGTAHSERYGADPAILVKLIDSAERLGIQVHPDRQRAQQLLGSQYGKTECWHILETRQDIHPAACVYFGFKPGITREKWKALFDVQDIPGMLDCLHRFEVAPGDTIYIPGGVPHAIGAGCLLAEIQEPTDYTIRVELTTPSGYRIDDEMCHRGMGFDRMFDCFDYQGLDEEQTRQRWFIPPMELSSSPGGRRNSLVDKRHTDYFRAEELLVTGTMEIETGGEYSCLYGLEGKATLSAGGKWSIGRGDQFFLPGALPTFTLTAESETPARILRFMGPPAG